MPGEVLATAEEYVPGPGVREENGRLVATVAGVLEVNDSRMEISVRRFAEWPEIREGCEVYGIVTEVMSDFVLVTVVLEDGHEREVVGGAQTGIIHVSKISKGFVKSPSDMFRVGDIIRARVIRARPTLHLSTIGRRYGVIRAYCTRCRTPLQYIHRNLFCPKCVKTESRKVAEDYGKPSIGGDGR